MKPVEIVTSLLSSQWAEWLADSLAFCDPEFAKVRDSFERILPSLYEKFGEQRIKELIQNEMAKQTIAMVFSSFLGLRYNLENFQSAIPLDFLNQEKDRYLKEDRLNCIPRYLAAREFTQKCMSEFGAEIREYEETILEYFCHMDMVLPAWAHYLGYTFGNQFLKVVEPGYCPDFVQTRDYALAFEKYFGFQPDYIQLTI